MLKTWNCLHIVYIRSSILNLTFSCCGFVSDSLQIFVSLTKNKKNCTDLALFSFQRTTLTRMALRVRILSLDFWKSKWKKASHHQKHRWIHNTSTKYIRKPTENENEHERDGEKNSLSNSSYLPSFAHFSRPIFNLICIQIHFAIAPARTHKRTFVQSIPVHEKHTHTEKPKLLK